MARIPEQLLEQLKAQVSVLRLVQESGVQLRKAGKDLMGRCPFHPDDSASLVVTPAKNLWHCFGCQVGGGPIDWVMQQRGVSFRHAVELLREGLPATSSSACAFSSAAGAEAFAVKRSSVRTLAAPVAMETDDQQLLDDVVGYYHDTLKTSPEALAYLEARGLRHDEAIATFKLGFANRTLGLRLPEKTRRAGAELRERLTRIGIYRESGHEHFNGSVVVPVFDAAGHVTDLYGRKIRDDLRPGTAYHLYLPGPHRGVWNAQALRDQREIIVCEALLDALSFWCAGYRNVTAAYGVEGFTAAHLAAMQQHGTQRVLIAYDRDGAGDRAAQQLAQALMAAGTECFRIQFPKGMDANEYACKVTPAAKSLGLAIRQALWLGQGAAPVTTTIATATTPRADLPSSAAAVAVAPAIAEPVPLPPPQPPLPASPVPPAPSAAPPVTVSESEVVLRFGEGAVARRWRVRGLAKNLAPGVLKLNVLVAKGEAFHVDTLDLYAARARQGFIVQAGAELALDDALVKADLGRVLLELERLQDAAIRAALDPPVPEAVAMSDAERDAALALLRAPDLLLRIGADFAACGIVGEGVNKLVGYLAATSRKLARPLAVVIQSSSAAGKSALMDAVLAFVPEEERIKYSAMTGQSLYYLGTTNLKHKVLAIVEEEGAHRASYALKLLQSEGELTIASTAKDPVSGNLITQQYRVEGPVMIFLTTTALEIDEELMNRCLVLSVDEARAQTRAIHHQQRNQRTLEGLLAQQDREAILAVHRHAQRLLQPLAVVNPYADRLSFPDTSARLRRDHEKYLTLIDTLALLHQYQRPVKTLARNGRVTEYVEVTLADIAQANALAHQVLGRSLDALPPQTRGVLLAIEAWVRERCQEGGLTRERCHFSRRELREALHLGDTQLRLHLNRLADLEYLLVHRGARGACFVYELLYDGQGGDGQPFLPGLIEAEALRAAAPASAPISASAPPPATTPTSRGPAPILAAPARAVRGADAVGARTGESLADPDAAPLAAASPDAIRETHFTGEPAPGGPYPQAPTPTPAPALSARVLPSAALALGQ